MKLPVLAALTSAILLWPTAPAAAQEPPHSHHGHAHRLGTVEFPNSGAPAAQEPFLRGIALLHSFEYEDARDAFREAQRADPGFALAYWAEALTNTQLLWGRDDAESAREALVRLAPDPASRLARAPTPRERAYGAAVEAFYADADVRSRARAFADSLRSLAYREPGDLEAAALASIALQMADGVVAFTGEERGTARDEAIALGERVFHANRHHPGAAHYLIHAFDHPDVAARGLEVARAYARIAPDAQHALHMPSHIFVQVGLWDDVVASNEQSWAASRSWVAARGASPTSLDFHSLEWLQHGYLQQGRYGAARALIDTTRAVLAGVDRAGTVDPYFVEARLTYRCASETGDWTSPVVPVGDPGAAPTAESRYAYFQLISAYQAAVGAIMSGDTEAHAVDAFRRLVEERASGQPARGYVAMMPLHVDALLARARGDVAGAIDLVTRASAIEAEIQPVGPPNALPSLELLGALLLEAGRPGDAADAYESALLRWPNRSASLLGLARSRRALGDGAAAAASYRRLLDNWHAADPDLDILEEVRLGAAPAADTVPLPIPASWDTAYVMLIEANPAYRPESDEAMQAVLQAHLQYQLRLIAQGRTIRGGPLARIEGAPLVGMSVLRAADLEEAEAVASADPGVAAGLFRATVRTWTTPAPPPSPPADPADVATIEGIMHAFYDVINGPPGQPRQWQRDSTLYMPGAMFVSLSEQDGRTVVEPMTPEEYRLRADAGFVADGAYEIETGSRIERFGNVAQVRSVGEFRREPGGPVLSRYVNYVLLYWDGSRWWISGAIWDEERPGAEIPPDWVGTRERVPE